MIEEKVYYRYVGEYGQKQRHLGESRVGMALSHVREMGSKRAERGELGTAARRSKRKWSNQSGWII